MRSPVHPEGPLLPPGLEEPALVLLDRLTIAQNESREAVAAAVANLRAARMALKVAEKAVEDATFARAFLVAVAKGRAP
jgi:hypothetical protein